jgi:hypothetical protein
MDIIFKHFNVVSTNVLPYIHTYIHTTHTSSDESGIRTRVLGWYTSFNKGLILLKVTKEDSKWTH